MGEKVATLRMARQELEDLYLGVPDGSVDLTFKDLVVRPAPPAAAAVSPTALAAIHEDGENERTGGKALLRSSTNIFTYKVVESDNDDNGGDQQQSDVHSAAGFQLSPSPSPPPARRRSRTAIRSSAAAEGTDEQPRSRNDLRRNGGVGHYKRPGIPHSNLCALCAGYVHILRHRCLSCGRVYCRRCVGAGIGMGDMPEGRKCVDCLGRKYSHRYIHKAGRTTSTAAGLLCSCGLHGWGKGSSLRAQELLWAEKGAAPRRRQSSSSTTSISASYSTAAAGGGGYSASMSMTMMSINSGAGAGAGTRYNRNKVVVQQPASSSFVGNSFSGGNPHAFPL